MKAYVEDGSTKYRRVCVEYRGVYKYYPDIDLKTLSDNMYKYLKHVPKNDWSLVSIMCDVLTVMPKGVYIIKKNNAKTLIHGSNTDPTCYSIETTFGRYVSETCIEELYSAEHLFSFKFKKRKFKMSSNKTKAYRVDVLDFAVTEKEWNTLFKPKVIKNV